MFGGRIPQREAVRFLKFAAVGLLGAIIDFSILNLLVLGFGWPKLLANLVSFTSAVCSNFVWNRLWTYPESRSRPVQSQLPKFFLLNVIGFAINTGVFLLADNFLLNTFHLSDALALNLGKMLAVGVAMFWNFGSNRLWTYRGL